MSLAKIQGFVRQGLWQGCWGTVVQALNARFFPPLGLVEFSRRSGRAWAWSGTPLSALRCVETKLFLGRFSGSRENPCSAEP